MQKLKLGLAALCILSASPALTAKQPVQSVKAFLENDGYKTIKLTKLATGHETIVVTINGVTGTFVLDSGAGATVVHLDRLPKYKLVSSSGGSRGTGAGGDIAITEHPVGAFALGAIKLPVNLVRGTNLESVVGQLKEATGAEIDGVIGQDVLTQFRGIINVAASELYLKIPAALKSKPKP